MKSLPKKPSELIRVALADLKAVEKNEKYRVNMNVWHARGFEYERHNNGVLKFDERGFPIKKSEHCAVCFAGAVMACTLKVDDSSEAEPIDKIFSKATTGKLLALNNFRSGYVRDGLLDMGVSHKKLEAVESFFDVTDYEDDPAKFKRDMRRLAKKLEEAGL